MQEQNFEKQVQDTLRELSLTPSVPVWQKVEQEIRQKKKRRRVIVFWLVAMLLAGGGAFWALYSTSGITGEQTPPALSSSQPTQQPHTHTPKKATTTSAVTGGKTSEVPTSPATSANHTPTTRIPEQKVSETEVEKTGIKEKQVLARKTSNKASQKQKQTSVATKATNTRTLQDEITGVPASDTEKSIVARTTTTEAQKERISSPKRSITSPATDTSTIALTEAPAIQQPEETPIALDSTQQSKTQKKSAKWSWSAQAGYGISSIQEDFLSNTMAIPESYSDPLNNSGFPTNPTPNFSSTAGIEKGAAFRLAIAANRNLTKRFALTAALQYSYFSTKNKVGQTVQRDTIIARNTRADNVVLNQFYRASQNGPLKDYINKYHFIELPIGIDWQVHQRVPLHLQTGISLSYLLATNALVFDPAAGIYYKNADLFKKTQLHVYSGLTYRVWKLKKLDLHVGPYVQFGVTSLQKENTNRHLFTTGLKTQVSF